MELATFLKKITHNQSSFQGFTLIEMLVVIGIIGILAAIIIVGQNNFSNATLLTDTTYTVALSVREAQSLGISSRLVSGVANAGYGVHFGNSHTSYIQFADIYPPAPGISTFYCPYHTSPAGLPDSRPGNCLYDSTDGENVETYNFSSGYKISKIAYVYLGSTNTFVPNGAESLDVVYERPNTEAEMTVTRGSSHLVATQATVDVTSPQGSTRCVVMTQLGEVSVSATCP